MPEGRMIKRVISESKKLGNLKSDSARLLYTWLIPWLDVEGRHSADPEIIKGHIFPKVKSMTIKKIERLLQELSDGRLIILYLSNGEMCLQFKKTIQKIDKAREAKSTIPPPENGKIIQAQENSRVGHENSSTNKDKIIKLNESKGKGSELTKAPDPPHLRIKFNFKEKKWRGILDEDLERWEKTFPGVDIEYHIFTRMVEWIISNPRKGRKKNYARFINNWLSDEQEKFDLKNAGKRKDDERAKEWYKEKD